MTSASSSGNDTLEAYQCDLPPFFPPSLNIPISIDYIQACVALMLGATGFLLNLFILLMVICYRVLHQRVMYLALQIVCIDLIYTLTIPLVIFVSGVSGAWILGGVMCNIIGIVHDFFAMFRFTTTLVLTLDRFISVFWPFFYYRKSHHLVLTLGGAMYIISILRALLPVTGILDCYVYIPTQKTCTAFSGCSEGCYWFVVCTTSIIVIFGAFIPLALYIVLFWKIRSIKRRYVPYLGTSEGPSRSPGADTAGAGTFEAKTSIVCLNGFGSRVASVQAKFGSKVSSTPAVDVKVRSRLGSAPAEFGSKLNTMSVIDDVEFEFSSAPKFGSMPAIGSDVEFGFRYNSYNGAILERNCDQTMPDNIANMKTVENGENVCSDILEPPNAPAEVVVGTESISSTHTKLKDLNSGGLVKFEPGLKASDGKKSLSAVSETISLKEWLKSRTVRSNARTNVTMFILLMSVIGCTAPAFVLYIIQFFYLKPEPGIFIVNMVVGRTFFNLLPVVDSFAIMRHREFRVASNRLFKSIRRKLRI